MVYRVNTTRVAIQCSTWCLPSAYEWPCSKMYIFDEDQRNYCSSHPSCMVFLFAYSSSFECCPRHAAVSPSPRNPLTPPRTSFFATAALDIFHDNTVLLAVVLLGGPLKRMDDMCNLSRDGLLLGALALGSLGGLDNTTFLRANKN